MKRSLLVSILILLFSLPLFAQTVTIDGYAILRGQSDHSGIQVLLHRTVPTSLYDTIITNSAGYYKKDIQKGIYDIIYYKKMFTQQTQKDVTCYSNKKLDTVKLEPGGMSGRLSGVLKKGDYVISDSVWVQKDDTLTIEPGTRLFFKKGKGLDVYGYFNAIGTEKDSIIFTRYITETDNPDSVYWNGIDFSYKGNVSKNQETDYSTKMKYCHVSYCSKKGIFTNNTSIEKHFNF